ncbi:MAG: hypothetical protein KJP08_08910 [Gammaproteobacteria bacterium]|nr:hypothetical protein [Gammaproteobacteria bacterium]NNL62630.1 hypothetical protein [Woeseiaceae bacterium]
MKIRTLTVFFWLMLIGAAAVAGEKYETHIKIEVDDGADTFEWHSEDADIESLEVGESKTLTSEGGKEATITRTEDGFVIESDGETVDIMKFHDSDHKMMTHGDHDVVIDTDKRVEKRIEVIKAGGDEAITIISTEGIDDAKRARIQSALEEAGVEGDVLFLDGSDLHEDGQAHARREVRIIRKEKDAK